MLLKLMNASETFLSSCCIHMVVAILAHIHASVYHVELNAAFRPCKQRAAAPAIQEMTSVQQMLSLYSNWSLSTQLCCEQLKKMAYGTPAVPFKACAMRI